MAIFDSKLFLSQRVYDDSQQESTDEIPSNTIKHNQIPLCYSNVYHDHSQWPAKLLVCPGLAHDFPVGHLQVLLEGEARIEAGESRMDTGIQRTLW